MLETLKDNAIAFGEKMCSEEFHVRNNDLGKTSKLSSLFSFTHASNIVDPWTHGSLKCHRHPTAAENLGLVSDSPKS